MTAPSSRPDTPAQEHADTVREALHLLGPDPEDDAARHEGQLNGYAALDALLAQVERLTAERDDYKADRDSYDELLGRKMAERDEWHKRAEAAEREREWLREQLDRQTENAEEEAT